MFRAQRPKLVLRFLLGFVLCIRAEIRSETCTALGFHRQSGNHVSFPLGHEATSLLLQNIGASWSMSLWLRVQAAHPSAIVSPILDLADTPLGLRLRACAPQLGGGK